MPRKLDPQSDAKPEPDRSAGRPGGGGFLEVVRRDFSIVVALLVIAASLLVGPWMVFGREPALMVAGGLLTAAAIVGFVFVVRAKTNRWKE